MPRVDAKDLVRVEVSHSFREAPVDCVQWNALVEATDSATVFQTFEWFKAWWDAFGGRHQLFLLSMWDGDVLVGLAPMMVIRRAALRRLEFVGFSAADYQDFILGNRADELLPVLARDLHARRDAWDILVLRNLPIDSATFAQLPGLFRDLHLDSTDHERIDCPTIEIASRRDDVRKLYDRYSFRRRIRRLQRDGKLQYIRCSTDEQLDHYLPLFFRQYTLRRRGSPAVGTFQREDVRAFYAALARSMMPHGWLHFSVLESAGRPIAFHFGFEHMGRLYWYKPSFDPTLAKLSPGKALLAHLIRDAVDRGLRELDFTIGGEAFKYRYSNTQRTNVNLRVFSRRWLYRAFLGVVATHRTFGRWYSALPRRLHRRAGLGPAPPSGRDERRYRSAPP